MTFKTRLLETVSRFREVKEKLDRQSRPVPIVSDWGSGCNSSLEDRQNRTGVATRGAKSPQEIKLMRLSPAPTIGLAVVVPADFTLFHTRVPSPARRR